MSTDTLIVLAHVVLSGGLLLFLGLHKPSRGHQPRTGAED